VEYREPTVEYREPTVEYREPTFGALALCWKLILASSSPEKYKIKNKNTS